MIIISSNNFNNHNHIENIEFKSDGDVIIFLKSPGDPAITATTSWSIEEDRICFESNDEFVQLAIDSEDLFEHFNSDMCVKYVYDEKGSRNGNPELILYLINEGEEYSLELGLDD